MMHGGSDYFGGHTPGQARNKLSPQQRDEICYRRMDGETATALAVEFGISATHIYNTLPPRERP